MKTHSIEWSPINTENSQIVLNPARQLQRILRLATKTFLAVVPALAVIVGATWLVNQPGEVVYLQALIWALGFVFVGLAVEAESAEMALLHLATGIALPVLAWLSAQVAIELVVVAATLVAAWVAAAILRR